MRVLQLIDSLEAGGAEKMAVSYANSLAGRISFSGIVATRREGKLKEMLQSDVHYLFLGRTKIIDFKAVMRLKNYITAHQVQILHAHGPSFFIAVLLKFVCPKIKIVWHEHYGARADQTRYNNKILYIFSFFFSAAFAVNLQLASWIKKNLLVENIICMPNFIFSNPSMTGTTILNGTPGKRIVMVANLKSPKNHIAALSAFHNLNLQAKGWSLHFIGENYSDSYSEALYTFIEKHKLDSSAWLYGAKQDIPFILSQADIALLTSTAEGFPLVLLEYGMAGLAVVSSNVGFCPEIIEEQSTGVLFDPFIEGKLEEALETLTFNDELRKNLGLRLCKRVQDKYTENEVISILISKYQAIAL
jgi:glycosyltransferase involved in cell wall biosynthesis